MSYLSVFAPSVFEKVIERSRFIAACAHTETEEQARAFVESIRTEHSLATHNCYAFVADKCGNLMRFSDDGEPQGTAGMPMLEVLKNKKLFETAVVVTRYFGGIKLGAGGLVRAYSGVCSDVLAQADIREYTPCREVCLTVAYEHFDALKKFLNVRNTLVNDVAYADKVGVSAAVGQDELSDFLSDVQNYMAGRIECEQRGESWYPFPVRTE